jgi:PAS domain S-box-containing protein
MRSPPSLPPLHLTIPLLLLVFAATLGFHDLHHNARHSSRGVEQYTRNELTQRLGGQQDHLELLLSLGKLERVREEIASLGADPHVKVALLIDENGTVAASTHRVEHGQQARVLHPELFTQEVEQQLRRSREHLTGDVQVTREGQSLVGFSPVMLPSSPQRLTPEKVWVLVVERDLTALKAQAMERVRQNVVQRSLLIAVLAGLLWLFFHFVLARRVNRLVTAAHRFAARDWAARSGLTGQDELAVVGRAFDEMAERLRATQSQLEERESRIRLLLDSAAEGIFGMDLEGRSTFANRSAARMLGYPDPGLLLGMDVHATWHHSREDGSPFPRGECAIVGALDAGKASHVAGDVLWRRDGTSFPVECWSYPMREGGRHIGGVTTFVDITERKRAEDAQRFLIEASTQLAELLDVRGTLERVARLAVPQLARWCVIDMVDDAGTLHAAAAVHQEPRKQALLQQWRELSPPEREQASPTVQVLHTGRPLLPPEATRALFHTSPSDPEHHELLCQLGARTALALPLTVRGQTLAALLLVSDKPGFQYGPHELALAEELARRGSVAMDNARLYLQSLQAVRLREDFLSVASHELHTPLTPLRLHLQTLQRAMAAQGDGAARLMPKVDKALGQVKRLSQLVDDLLDVSRLTAGRLRLHWEQVDLVELTGELLERFSEQARAADCTLHLRAEGSIIGHWDRMRLEQVLTNLVTNALKYGQGHPVEFHLTASGGWASWSIRDHGIGIAPEDLDRIFGRFERAVPTRKYGGLGMGLYISRAIVRAHGGDIRVESWPGQGSVFTAELPLEPAQASRDLAETHAPESSLHSPPPV